MSGSDRHGVMVNAIEHMREASPTDAFSILRQLFDQEGEAKLLLQAVNIEAVEEIIADHGLYMKWSNLPQSGCIEAAVKAMAVHSDNFGLLRVGCMLFAEMSARCFDTKYYLFQCGCIKAVREAMAIHGDSSKLSTDGCFVFSYLADVGAARKYLLESGCIEVALKAVAAHSQNWSLAYDACLLFKVLAAYRIPDCTQHLFKAGCVEAVLKMVGTHGLQNMSVDDHTWGPGIVAHPGCCFFRNMAAISEERRQCLCKSGCIEVALRAMTIHDADDFLSNVPRAVCQFLGFHSTCGLAAG